MGPKKSEKKKKHVPDEEEEMGRYLLLVRGETIRATELGRRNLVFLPFNTYWLMAVNSVAVFLLLYDCYFLMFGNSLGSDMNLEVLYAWLILLVDLCFSVLHKLWERVNRSRSYKPKSWFVILIDIICTHPILLVQFIVFKSLDVSAFVYWFILAVDVLRLYRIFLFYNFLKSKIGLNQLLVHIIFFELILLLLSDLTAAIWCSVEWYMGKGTTTFLLRGSKGLLAFCEIHMYIFDLFLGFSINVSHMGTVTDMVLLMFPILAGFWLINVFRIILIMDFLKKMDHYFNYRTTLHVADIYLKNFDIKKGVREDFLDFYKTLWELWWGIRWEESLEQLPLSLKKEITVDISWDAIQHSQSLRYQGLNFKRDIALRMYFQMYRPGDYVIDYDDIKSSMWYLASGNVQVMSRYDNTCPLLSFSQGTIVGGKSVIIPIKSQMAVRSSSYCEMHILRTSQLFDVALSYPWEARYLHLRYFDSLQDAYTMSKVQKLFQTRQKVYDKILVQPDINCISWLKKRWRLINSYSSATKEEAKEIVKDIPVMEQFTSKYLDMYVISDDLELKRDRFCLEASWPFVIEPESNFLKLWNIFILILLTHDSLMLPYYAVFTNKIPYLINHISVFNQIMFALDSFFYSITAIKTKSSIIMTATAIIRYRLKRIGFAVDVVSSLPFGIALRFFGKSDKVVIFGALLRLLKIYKVLNLLIKLESNIMSSTVIPWIRHMVVYMFLIYWSSCFMFYISCPDPLDPSSCSSDGWVSTARKYFKGQDLGEEYKCFYNYLTVSIYYVMTATHQMDSSDISTNSVTERICLFIISCIIQTYVLYFTGHLIALSLLDNSLEASFSELKKNTQHFAKVRHFPKRLTQNLMDYMDLQWNYENAYQFLIRKNIFHDAPEKLNSELTNYFKEILMSYKLFYGESEETVHMIDKMAEKARIIMLPKHFVICKAGTRATCLTIVRKGYIRLISHLKSDISKFPDGKLIGAGAAFPQIELLYNGNSAISCYTVTNCECIVIDQPDFIIALHTNKQLIKKLELISSSKSAIHTLNDDLEPHFQPEMPQTHNSSFILRNPFFCNRNNLLRVILHLLFPKYCFSPSGLFVYYWEFSRFLIIPLTVNFYVLYMIIFFPLYPDISSNVSLFFDSLSFLDIYFRLNTAYYSKEGILIVDVCQVVHRYLTSSFLVDFLAAVPWQKMMTVDEVVDFAWLTLAVFKILPIYRVIRFDSVLGKRRKNKKIVHVYTVSVIFTTVILFMTCQYFLYFCFTQYRNSRFYKIFCKFQLILGDDFILTRIQDMFIVILGSLMGMILKMKSEIIQARTELEMYLVIFYGFFMTFLRVEFLAKCCGWAKTGSRDYTLFKQRVYNLIDYIKKNLDDVKLEKVIYNFFLSYWDHHMSEDISWMLSKLHPTLRIRILGHLYFSKLRLVSFLREADEYLLRMLSFNVQELFVLKGQSIVEEFEITKNIYIIWEGEVVVTVGKISPVVLGPGCLFGCLQQVGIMKHIFSYQAVKHTSMLKIEASNFHVVLSQFPQIHHAFLRLCQPSREYLVTGQEVPIQESFIDLTEVTSSSRITTSSSKYMVTYLFITYTVAYLTVIFVCCLYLFGPKPWVLQSLLIIDLVTLWKIVTRLTLPFEDSKTGLIVTDKKLIRRKYMSTKDFYIDVITLLIQWYNKWFVLVKLLRVFEVYQKVQERSDSVFTKNWEGWVHSSLMLSLIIILSATFWALFLGSTIKVYHYENGKFVVTTPDSQWERVLNSLMFIITLFTSTSRIVIIKFPVNIKEALAGILITPFFFVVTRVFFAYLTAFVEKVTWHERFYENMMQRQRQFLKHRDLSQCLLESTWDHAELLWQRSKGEYSPSVISKLPFPLKKKIMYALFGRHLIQSHIFKHTHIEFIRNLSTRFDLTVYFPGESVVVEGDVDGTMYFVHSGEVDVLKTTGKDDEKLVGILTVGEAFGYCQGLYECRPHPRSYKARSTSEILSLQRKHWQDLMLFYESQTDTVYQRAAKLPYEFSINYDYLG